ncbi:MAG: ABC transporter permease [Solirubrobacteraceae bacterium]
MSISPTGPSTAAAGTEFSDDLSGGFLGDGEDAAPGIGPWKLAWRRLRRNRVSLAFGGLFLVIVALCVLAPVYANDIAHTSPSFGNPTGTVKVGGKTEYILSLTGIPIGPTWHSHYLLGADGNGRDVAVRLLYGGRNSLEIGVVATMITMIIAMILGVVAGYFRGLADGIISRFLDVLWAYPAVLLGVALGVSLAVGGINFGLFALSGTTLLVPAFVIGIVYIPYVAKPVRGQVLVMREREFVDAARQQGLGHMRIMFTEILPNLSSTIIVFIPLILANAILLEAGLSYLGAGVQPPNPSWGTMISDGINTIPAAFHNVLVPGIMLVLTVLSINVFGDGLRDALDPRAKVRIAH